MLFRPPLRASFLRAMQPMQLSAQFVYLAFIRGLLSLGNFDKLEHFLHLFHNLLQLFDNLRDFANRFDNGRRSGRRSGGNLLGQFRDTLNRRQSLARCDGRRGEFGASSGAFALTLCLARPSPTAAASTPPASSAAGGGARPARLRLFWILFSVFNHVHSQHERARFKWKG